MSGKHLFDDEWLVRAASTLPGVPERLEGFRAERRPRLFDALVESGVASEEAVREAVRATHRVHSLVGAEVERPAVALIPEKVCRRYHLVPVRLRDEVVEVAALNPLDLEALADVQAITGRVPSPLLARAGQIVTLLSQAFSPDSIVNDLVDRLGESGDAVEVVGEREMGPAAGDDVGPVGKLAASLIAKAFHMRASDIHLEHEEAQSTVRFRIDGSLKNITTLPRFVGAGALTSRLKIMANLDIADRLRPQDGRAKLRIGTTELGLRVSTLPTNFGEKVVIRLLDKRAAEVPFEKLGIRPDIAERLGECVKSAQGVVLVTGPTGSGKTTTLYSVLNRLKSEDTNIVTAEDPVEYKIEGINQVQVNEKQGLTFSAVLRSVLRQDPDVILLGEIRDKETADIAMQAALTGHLVLSSLHTNDALATVARLVDMGVEPFKLAPALLAITAQRLVRRLCDCRVPAATVPPALAEAMKARGHQPAVFEPKGCQACSFTGFKGRTSIVEFLEVLPPLKQRIAAGAGEAELRETALKEKCLSTMLDDALWHVSRGDTTLEEVAPYVKLDAKAAAPVPAAAPAAAPAAPRPSAGGKPRVLVADDDATIRVILRKVLEGQGYEVEEAPDGAAALAAVAAAEPAMLIADLNMPGMGGYELIRGVRESLGLTRLPVIVLTADADDASQTKAFEAGADDYLIKPLKIPIVTARVKAAFRRSTAA